MELRLTRTILQRLECSFARQEAKLDQLLGMKTTTNTGARTIERPTFQIAQCLPQRTQAEQFSTPVPTSQPVATSCLSVEYTPEMIERTAMLDLERLLDDPNLTGNLKLTFFKLISLRTDPFVWSE